MKNRYLRRFAGVLVAVVLLVAQGVQAMNLHWLENTPAQAFTEQDWQLLQDTVLKALNESASGGDRLSWSNPASGNSGSVTNMGPANQDGRTCIRLSIHNKTQHLSGTSVARFCRQGDDSWKMEGQ